LIIQGFIVKNKKDIVENISAILFLSKTFATCLFLSA